jgi:hypothetical protein
MEIAPGYERPFTIGGRPSYLDAIGVFTVADGVSNFVVIIKNGDIVKNTLEWQ